MASSRRTAVSLLMAVLFASVMVLCDASVSQNYELQRRTGSEGSWVSVGTFTLSRHSAHASPRMRFTAPADRDLSKEEKTALTTADLVYYRTIPAGKPEEAAAVVAISPCSIIRGFEAVDSSTVVLREKLRVAPGPGASIIGLQATSDTNFFHSKMTDGDECDLSVVETLFPTVRVKLELSLLPSVELLSKVNYGDLRIFAGEEGASAGGSGGKAQAKSQKKTQMRRVKNADGEWVEEEVEVDDRSFLQKYWMYIAIPLVMSVIQNMGKQ